MKITLEKRILLFAFLILTLTITVDTGFNIEGFRRDYREGLIQRCANLARGLSLAVQHRLARGTPLAEQRWLAVRAREVVDADPEIVYCLVENAAGGWRVAELLAGDQATRDIPVVFISARAAHDDVLRAQELGAVGYVVKPFDPLELAAVVRTVLERVARGERELLNRELLPEE